MRSLLLSCLSLSLSLLTFAQPHKLKSHKYPSLLWEISGKGMSKPSYLFGTMHVSNKMAFHLSDSFYLGIRNADVVALETNPGNWQEDFSRYELEGNPYLNYRNRTASARPQDFFSINSIKAFPYDKLIGRSLFSNPSIINSFLYRSNAEGGSEFEEDTYLDLYIFQVGRKWNKRLCGVEDFDESMNLMKEAYADAAKDKNVRERSYDNDNEFSYGKLEEAYRTGNLDLLDTINKVNSASQAFDEKFLYKRNEIQARSIDSIIRSKVSLFVGVGAAHLPGERGVIEMLRRMGYKLRPIRMTERDSRHKDAIEAARVPVAFSQQVSEDGLFSVSLPGKLYSFGSSNGLVRQQQYADMSNGSYYMVTRIPTLAPLWGHQPATVLRKLDSLLYENIPGKILSKKPIVKNGYNGFDIVNRTRRGDYQRYQILVTPFEVLLFKVSGSGEYIRMGKEAETFFNSIQLSETKPEWKKWSPSFGGFEVDLPHTPYIMDGGNWNFQALDRSNNTNYQVIRTDVHNVDFVEEDSFDLNLMEESFGSSEFIDKQLSRRQGRYQGYPSLDASYRYKNGNIALVRFLIRGPHYYTLVSNSATEHPKMKAFLNSFAIKPFSYGVAGKKVDTTLFYTVHSPVAVDKPRKLSMYPEDLFNYTRGGADDEAHLYERPTVKDKVVSFDSTGEKIYVTFFKTSRYYFNKDTVAHADTLRYKTQDQEWTYRSRKKTVLKDSTIVWDTEVGDPLSSRMVRSKVMNSNGVRYRITVQGDTLSRWSPFVEDFFQSFQPADTVKGWDPRVKKSPLFFADFFSGDTTAHKRAVKNVDALQLDSSDFAPLQSAIRSLSWKEKKYLDVKNAFIARLSQVRSPAAADYLREIYFAAGDTIEMQYTALEALLQQQTAYAFQVFKSIMTTEPPVLNVGSNGNAYTAIRGYRNEVGVQQSNGDFMDELRDSLELTRTIFKDLLPLLTVNDYEKPMLDLLEVMVDSGMIAAKDYETYLPKLLIEARQEMKKQVIAEKNRSIELAQTVTEDKKSGSGRDEESSQGNEKLDAYTTLLLPFWEMNAAVPQLFRQLLSSSDKRLKYNTAWHMMRKGRVVPDTLFAYYAAQPEFRSELYADLKKLRMLNRFPQFWNNHVALAKSELLSMGSYTAPDTVEYLDRLPASYKERSGYVYFFRYKKKKDDNGWKLAAVGLVPKDEKEYSFEAKSNYAEENEYSFTELTDTKLDEEEPVKTQLQKVLRKKLYAKRKSAAAFYEEESETVYNFKDGE